WTVNSPPLSHAFFFFSSRRRHTSFSRDWSSDVCSSDLPRRTAGAPPRPQKLLLPCRGGHPQFSSVGVGCAHSKPFAPAKTCCGLASPWSRCGADPQPGDG